MARIPVKLRLETFHLDRQLDKSSDQPYVVVAYGNVDGNILDTSVPFSQRKPRIHMPSGLGHGDLGPSSKNMKAGDTITVPQNIGEYSAVLDTAGADMAGIVVDNVSLVAAVLFFEEDSTTDGVVLRLLPDALDKVQANLDIALLKLTGEWGKVAGKLPGTAPVRDSAFAGESRFPGRPAEPSLLDPETLVTNDVLSDVIDEHKNDEIAKALGEAVGVAKIFFPESIGSIIGGLVGGLSPLDYDDKVGRGVVQVSFARLVSTGGRVSFQLGEDKAGGVTAGNPADAANAPAVPPRYRITGWVKRTDTDEPPCLAAVARGDEVHVFARLTRGDLVRCFRSSDFGRSFARSDLPITGTPAACGLGAGSTLDGSVRAVVTRRSAEPGNIALSASRDGGGWGEWRSIPHARDFAGTPRIAISEGGVIWHVVARDAEDRCVYSRSENGGVTWAPFIVVGSAKITSSPAIAVMPRGRVPGSLAHRVVLAARGPGGALSRARWMDGEDPTLARWEALPVSNVTSAPSLMTGRDGRSLVLVARGSDARYMQGESLNEGESFGIFQTLGVAESTKAGSAPALVSNMAGDVRLAVGLNRKLLPMRLRFAPGDEGKRKWARPDGLDAPDLVY